MKIAVESVNQENLFQFNDFVSISFVNYIYIQYFTFINTLSVVYRVHHL